jgi:hypothetical protein
MIIVVTALFVCLLLAKQTKNEKKQEFDLSALPQLTLSGRKSVELLKQGLEIFSPYKVLSGLMGDMLDEFDLPVEAFHLDVKKAAYLVFGFGEDRPVLVYQNSAINILFAQIAGWNASGFLDGVEMQESGLIQIQVGVDDDGQLYSESQYWDREAGKMGKYILVSKPDRI